MCSLGPIVPSHGERASESLSMYGDCAPVGSRDKADGQGIRGLRP